MSATYIITKPAESSSNDADVKKRKKRKVDHSLSTFQEFDLRPLQCGLCDFRCSSNSALVNHEKTHLTDGRFFACSVCHVSFDQRSLLIDHEENEHREASGERNYVCRQDCGKTFDTLKKFRTHARYCAADFIHRCPICPRVFKRIDKLRRHLITHSERRQYLCAKCGRQFRRADKLKEHDRIRHAPGDNCQTKPVAAEVNGEVAADDDEIMTHDEFSSFLITSNDDAAPSFSIETTDDGVTFRCMPCSRMFCRHGMFVKHMGSEHPDVDLNHLIGRLPVFSNRVVYRCPFCQGTFANFGRLKNHVRAKHDEAYQWDEPRKVQTKVKVAIPLAPTKCPHCQCQYLNVWKLREHIRDKHDNICQLANQSIDEMFERQLIEIENAYNNTPMQPEYVVFDESMPMSGFECSSRDTPFVVPLNPSPSVTPELMPQEFILDHASAMISNGEPFYRETVCNFGRVGVSDDFATTRPVTPVTPIPVSMLNGKLATPQFTCNVNGQD